MESQEEQRLLRTFASCIFKEVQAYVQTHQEEYAEWQKQFLSKREDN